MNGLPTTLCFGARTDKMTPFCWVWVVWELDTDGCGMASAPEELQHKIQHAKKQRSILKSC